VSISSPEAKTEPKRYPDRNYWLILCLLAALFIAFTAFAEGYRLPGWFYCKPAVIWAAYPLQFVLLCLLGIQQVAAPSRKILLVWSGLTLLTLGLCLGGYRVIERLGRGLIQWEVSPVDLANDCRRLIDEEGRAAGAGSTPGGSRPLAPQRWPESIRRLRPMYVTVDGDQIRLELHGGFDHYGYTLERADGNPSWVLQWYSEGNIRETLATIPATE
jgi:hypothetical protein